MIAAVPKCVSCHRFDHDADHSIKTYVVATCSGEQNDNAEHVIDETDAQEALEKAAPATESRKHGHGGRPGRVGAPAEGGR